ncbi:thioesterase-like superfamily-domain-containing protein [Cercophora newfieldiana]|uniref:Thioesterase-like superfamily-domain-containing protein n=1 Tax=Cercophora newfieldiana TaxID=92897 RepID=A0AA40CRI4_9PEZI|nr:thioesterase-like superfamily-domain-containing protein [Cercophora newfieldiana]
MTSQDDPRLSFQEALELVNLPPHNGASSQARRFMGTRAAHLPGVEIEFNVHTAAYGGHVYGQAALAVCRAQRELEDQKGVKPSDRLGLHTIHGYFTRVGHTDRPFIYEVTPLTNSKNFSTVSVTAHQPSQPSTNPDFRVPHGGPFPLKDAALPPLPTCYAAVCSFKSAEPHSRGVSIQDEPAQKRFASILAQRRPQDWPPSPLVDIDGVMDMVGTDQMVGVFPVVDMKKVDMREFNKGKPVHERVELILYRLLKPLPSDGTDGYDANAHVVAHAFTVDRNGLIMGGNHLGFGWSLSKAASLSYTLVVHVNAEDCVMHDGEDQWWIQEVTFPRAAHGRGIVMSRIWSPDGVHVATEYQDGLIRSSEEKPAKEKL